jgi:hypothetical protein
VKLEALLSYFDEVGVDHKENTTSIILRHCPNCNSDDWKVWLFMDRLSENRPFNGHCHKCEERYTSYSYLLANGQDIKEVRELHGWGPLSDEEIENLEETLEDDEEEEKSLKKEAYVPKLFSTAGLVPLTDKSAEKVFAYAKSRGIPEALYPTIMADPRTSAVTFLCIEDSEIVGMQKRFLNPFNPKVKTWNPPEFKKNYHVIEYKNSGDVLVSEGPFTAVAAYNYGFHAICTFGAGVSEIQLFKIKRILEKEKKNKLAVAYDLDKAGLKGFLRIKNYFEQYGIDTYRVLPEQGNDLNDSWMAGKKYTIKSSEDDFDSTQPMLEGDLFLSHYLR